MNPEPFRIEPTFSPRLWGSRSLAPLFPEKTDLTEPIGEAWLTDVNCRIATGSFSGISLKDAWREMSAEWRGTIFAQPGDFPLLVKFIFPTDKLSIQVHPDDEYAAAHEQAAGGRGKTETWHIVSADPNASLLLGLKPGTTKEKFLAALGNHTLEELFQRHAVAAGDTFFIPAKTQHTIGANMVVFEVQEYSDLTYRVYDYGRVDPSGKPRELHIEKAIAVTDFDSKQIEKVPRVTLPTQRGTRSLLTACPYFAMERAEYAGLCDCSTSKMRFEILVVLHGKGQIRWTGGEANYSTGECWFIPANLDAFVIQPLHESSIIRTYVPDLAASKKSWQDAGISSDVLSRTVFG
ncbi:MAG TPA: type I phosphomannose isomerase catalytic subunit [Candidatus Dormibacteraeota bacterium]|jgi:mannose-6-phosphate isomerase|nr:type I phosphomannose isomerase catalytic subunit [Candidatus Dormibacteraeota bacterium]